ncbi:MAG TPA: methyltransferase domain-containing protein [Burkholderiales bacterium]|jgi:SAM-dependent methyltransferase
MVELSANFAGSIPEYYDKCLGPAWFQAYAADLAGRLPAGPPADVLELACGTGIVTRCLRERLDPSLRLVASDLSKAMLGFACNKLIECRGIEWREADATSLPFDDGEFGAVVCAFGIMFVPDKRAAIREARRVLKKGGILLFNVWDRIERNRHVALTAEVMEDLFPGDAELSFRRLYEMYDPALLRTLLAEAAFQETRIERKQIEVRGVSARSIATGLIRGSPRSLLIEKRGASLDEVIERISAALAKAGGDPYSGQANAVVVEAQAA